MPAAAFDSASDAPELFLCPISQELMRDPVICCDGFSYEEENIKQWIEQERGGRVLSPMTGVPLANLSLTKNHVLRQAIEAFTEGLCKPRSQQTPKARRRTT